LALVINQKAALLLVVRAASRLLSKVHHGKTHTFSRGASNQTHV
jgi:hypothetical protein